MSPLLLPVPHFMQRQRGECLAACAQMVLTYMGRSVAYGRLLKLLRIKSGLGTLASNIRRLETLNLEVIFEPGTFERLQDHLQQDRPCIVFIYTGELSYWPEGIDHAVVVVGLDDQNVYVNDPIFATAPLQVDRGEFDLAWLEWDEQYAVFIPRS
jgi:ABC-type bacteriocin/lantibiotic exporter with double-glycine peptidase domain